GAEFSEKSLVRTVEIVEREKTQRSDQEALDRWFQGLLHASNLPFLPDEASVPAADAETAKAELRAAREQAGTLAPEAAPAMKTFKEAEERLRTLAKLDLILRANLRFKAADFDLKGAGAQDVLSARRPMEHQRDDSRARLGPVQEALVRRLTLALRLGPADEGLTRLFAAQGALRAAYPEFAKLMDSFEAAGMLLGNIQGNEENEALIGQIRAASMRWEKMLGKVRPALAAAAYPFDHAKGPLTLADFMLARVPSADDIGATIGAVQELGDKYYDAYTRVMGRLVRRAEEIEGADPRT
ncbi:MAG TPA: hypothetical protein VJB14_10645, partial [Planctomycetota bacterium]|nr:hypothetical protein [Planctomycetota bacterium]